MVAGKDNSSLQVQAPIDNLSPHVGWHLLPLINWRPDSLQLHRLAPLRPFDRPPKIC
jgi:hypothetical protein